MESLRKWLSYFCFTIKANYSAWEYLTGYMRLPHQFRIKIAHAYLQRGSLWWRTGANHKKFVFSKRVCIQIFKFCTESHTLVQGSSPVYVAKSSSFISPLQLVLHFQKLIIGKELFTQWIISVELSALFLYLLVFILFLHWTGKNMTFIASDHQILSVCLPR